MDGALLVSSGLSLVGLWLEKLGLIYLVLMMDSLLIFTRIPLRLVWFCRGAGLGESWSFWMVLPGMDLPSS